MSAKGNSASHLPFPRHHKRLVAPQPGDLPVDVPHLRLQKSRAIAGDDRLGWRQVGKHFGRHEPANVGNRGAFAKTSTSGIALPPLHRSLPVCILHSCVLSSSQSRLPPWFVPRISPRRTTPSRKPAGRCRRRKSRPKMELPPGFHVTLFAAEPDVQHPIAHDAPIRADGCGSRRITPTPNAR